MAAQAFRRAPTYRERSGRSLGAVLLDRRTGGVDLVSGPTEVIQAKGGEFPALLRSDRCDEPEQMGASTVISRDCVSGPRALGERAAALLALHQGPSTRAGTDMSPKPSLRVHLVPSWVFNVDVDRLAGPRFVDCSERVGGERVIAFGSLRGSRTRLQLVHQAAKVVAYKHQ